MTKLKRIFVSVTLGITVSMGFSQEALTLERAIEIALENNHQINILRNQLEIADNSTHPGNAGLLPTVNLSGSAGGAVNNTELEFAGGIPPNNIKGARNSTIQGGASVNYILFGGLRGQRSYQKLKLNRDAVDLQTRAAIEATILQVAQAFYSVIQAEDQKEIAALGTTISNKRLERATLGYELGSVSRVELLSARVDMTSDSSAYLNAELQASNARRNLGKILGAQLESSLEIALEESDIQVWSIEDLENTAMENNATLKNLELQSEMAKKDLQISWSSILPTLSINGGYIYTNQQNEAGILLSNVSNGWNGNIGLSYSLFDGFRNHIARQNAAVLLEMSELQLEDQKEQLKTDLHNGFATYDQAVTALNFERKNLEASETNLERSEELLKMGQITSVQFREAQRAHMAALSRISSSRIAVRLSELNLMRLSGQMLSED